MRLDYIENMDCFEGMQGIPSGTVDMVLCDLPYGNTRNTWDTQLSLDKLWSEYRRIVKPNGAICLFSDGMFTAALMTSQPKMWRYNLVWDKVLTTGFLSANKRPLKQTENICVFYQKQPTYHPIMRKGKQNHAVGRKVGRERASAGDDNHNYGAHTAVDNRDKLGEMKHPTNLIRCQKIHPAKTLHPTEKPVALLEQLIQTYTNPGEIVLDNCIGSGSTAVACIQTGRHYIGFETSYSYYETAKRRVAEAQNQKHTLFELMK